MLPSLKSGTSMRQLTADINREFLRHVPDEEIYSFSPRAGCLTMAADDATGYYVKLTVCVTCLDFQESDFLPELMLQEARTMEVLAQHRHPRMSAIMTAV
jgi:hypothetical protein